MDLEENLKRELEKYIELNYNPDEKYIFIKPTADTLFLLVLSILALELVHSIRFLYQYFLSGITKKSFRSQRSPRVCHINHKRWRCKMLVFQYGFTWTSGDFLCMARKNSIKSDWQWLDAVHTIIFIFIPMEYRSELLWAENILVFMQLYGTKLQRNRNDGKSYQHQLLCNETAALCRQWICWLQR